MTWTTIVHDIPAEEREALLEYCHSAEEKDKSFRMQVLEDRVIIKSPNKDIAYRRGMLLYYKYHSFFEVIYEVDKAKIH